MVWFVLMGMAGAGLGYMSASMGVLAGTVFGLFMGALVKAIFARLRAGGGATGDDAWGIDWGSGDSDCGDAGGCDGGGDGGGGD